MLIPENGQWRWNDGPLCDTREEALATAKKPTVNDSAAQVYVVDGLTETLRVREDGDK